MQCRLVITHLVIHSFVNVWFADDIIITCVRWYMRFKLSYRDLAELVRELGVGVAPSSWASCRYPRALA